MTAYEILDDRPWWVHPCPHDEWDPCYKHHGEHDECRQCGALRYKIICGQNAVTSSES